MEENKGGKENEVSVCSETVETEKSVPHVRMNIETDRKHRIREIEDEWRNKTALEKKETKSCGNLRSNRLRDSSHDQNKNQNMNLTGIYQTINFRLWSVIKSTQCKSARRKLRDSVTLKRDRENNSKQSLV